MKQGSSHGLEVGIAEACRLRDAGAPVFDVRDPDEQALGRIAGAGTLQTAHLDASPALAALAAEERLLLCCTSGRRSLAVARQLRTRGFALAASVRGGFAAWQAEGLPCEYPCGMEPAALERYARQVALPAVGVRGQAALQIASVLLVGAGGLGSPAGFYLAAAGVGRIGIIDDDRVERSNLQRQILHVDSAAGRPKVESARERLAALNPDIQIEAIEARLDAANAEALIEGWDLVVDGSDNLATRYLVNAECVRRGIPLVYGAVLGFDGQVGVFHPAGNPGVSPCYRCLFPPPEQAPPDCNVAGVLGVLPGVVGMLQATEAIKILLGLGESLQGRLVLLDLLTMRFRTINTHADPACPVCGDQSIQDCR